MYMFWIIHVWQLSLHLSHHYNGQLRVHCICKWNLVYSAGYIIKLYDYYLWRTIKEGSLITYITRIKRKYQEMLLTFQDYRPIKHREIFSEDVRPAWKQKVSTSKMHSKVHCTSRETQISNSWLMQIFYAIIPIKAPVLWDTTKNISHMRYCVVLLRLVVARLLHTSKYDNTLACDK